MSNKTTSHKKRSKLGLYAAGVALLLIFGGFTVTKFASAVTPYVDYEAAMATERTVQVAGGLLQGSSVYDSDAGQLHFTLVDTEDAARQIAVRYDGLKPANFEDAVSIVAIGRYDPATEEFAASELLVKCPSKYQGIEGYEEKQYGAGSGDSSYDTESYADKTHS